MPYLNVGKEIGPLVSTNYQSLQWRRKVGKTIADLKTVSLERRDASVYPESHHGLRKIHTIARGPAANLCSALAKDCS
jgi:hypothetical protein